MASIDSSLAESINAQVLTTRTSASSSSSALPFFVILTASGSRTRIETCLPRNSTGGSVGETQRSNAGLAFSSPTVTLTYVRLSGRIATRFCSPDSAGGELDVSCVLASSSRVTGFARRTSGSPGATGAAAIAVGATVGAAATFGATEGADAILPGAVAAGPGLEAGTDDEPGDVCAVVSPCPGASRRTFRNNFITEKPTTNTMIPKISGIGEIRSLRPRAATGRRGATGVRTGFGG